MWPDPNIPLSVFRRPNIRFAIVVCTLMFFVTTPQVMNVFRAWGNVARMVENFASLNFSMIALCKLIVTWYHRETLHTLMTSIMSDWITSKINWERSTMLNMARHGRNLSFRCYFISTSTVLFYITINLMKFYGNMHQPQRILVYQFPFPYDTQKSPGYEITFFLQLSGGMYSAFINSTIDSYISILLLHVSAQLMNLRTGLNILVDQLANRSISSSRFTEDLGAIVMRHEHLIRNIKTINDCYSGLLFVQMLAFTFQLCVEVFQVFTIITEHLDVPFIKIIYLTFYVFMVVSHLYMYCCTSERLLMESTVLAYGVYECRWYDLPSENAKDLMFIVHRSKIPLRLSAGKFGFFSMELFGSTLKASMGYLSALLTMKEK